MIFVTSLVFFSTFKTILLSFLRHKSNFADTSNFPMTPYTSVFLYPQHASLRPTYSSNYYASPARDDSVIGSQKLWTFHLFHTTVNFLRVTRLHNLQRSVPGYFTMFLILSEQGARNFSLSLSRKKLTQRVARLRTQYLVCCMSV